jgi:hypothetical protein
MLDWLLPLVTLAVQAMLMRAIRNWLLLDFRGEGDEKVHRGRHCLIVKEGFIGNKEYF